jgi:hypothetical protein
LSHIFVSFLLFHGFFPPSAKDWTQGSIHATCALYHWATPPAPAFLLIKYILVHYFIFSIVC